jgi:TRAP-type uncharacterized transport system fused permease subunit
VFVYAPVMLIVTKGFSWGGFVEVVLGCAVGVVMLAAALTGYGVATLSTVWRLWLGFAALLVMSPSRTATLIGLVMLVPVLVQQMRARASAVTT